MAVPRIGIVSCSSCTYIEPAQDVLASELAWTGPWRDDPSVDWSAYSLVIVRTTWDYHLDGKRNAFRQWLTHLEQIHTQVQNPPAIMKWNMDKKYLEELSLHGIPTPKTIWLLKVHEILKCR